MDKGLQEDVENIDGSIVPVSSSEGSEIIAERLHLDGNSDVFAASKVTIYGIEYILNMFLVTGMDDNDDPLFGRIVIIKNNKLHLYSA